MPTSSPIFSLSRDPPCCSITPPTNTPPHRCRRPSLRPLIHVLINPSDSFLCIATSCFPRLLYHFSLLEWMHPAPTIHESITPPPRQRVLPLSSMTRSFLSVARKARHSPSSGRAFHPLVVRPPSRHRDRREAKPNLRSRFHFPFLFERLNLATLVCAPFTVFLLSNNADDPFIDFELSFPLGKFPRI